MGASVRLIVRMFGGTEHPAVSATCAKARRATPRCRFKSLSITNGESYIPLTAFSGRQTTRFASHNIFCFYFFLCSALKLIVSLFGFQTVARFDRYIDGIKTGEILPDVSFKLFDAEGNATIYRAPYFICDGTYNLNQFRPAVINLIEFFFY